MELAVIVDSVPLVLRERAIGALLIASMGLSTFLFGSSNETIEGFVLSVCDHTGVFIHTVGALHVGSMVTLGFRNDTGSHAHAVSALDP